MASSKVSYWCYLAVQILLLSILFVCVDCERVKQKIYDDIQPNMACFKRFNGTHEIGCTSKFNGNIGIIHLLRNSSDLDWVLKNGPHDPYILALYPELLTSKTLRDAESSGKVSGVVVLVPQNYDPETKLPSGFSGELKCPDEELGLYNESGNSEYAGYCSKSKNPWNPTGTALLFESWSFPMFLINNHSSVDNIVDCFTQFNEPINGEPRSWPLCALELKSNMFGTTNTEVCMRRSAHVSFYGRFNFCDPLSNYNIIGTVKPMNNSEGIQNKSVIVVAARMDATSMFDNISPGSESAVSGMVTLMATAGALNEYREEILKSVKNVLFVLYEGEAWDYIGSSRMVWDMERGEFPFKEQEDMPDQMAQFKFEHIDYFIEISQVGKMENNQLYLHSDPISNDDDDIKNATDELVNTIAKAVNLTGNKINIEKPADNMPLPPASIQSFLKRYNISGLVLADHKEEFKNRYYQSVFDDERNIQGDNITHVASVLATTLYRLLMPDEKEMTVIANSSLTEELLSCYANVSCQMFKDFGKRVSSRYFDGSPAKMYISVKGSVINSITTNIFVSLLGELVNMNETDCKPDNMYQVNQYYYFDKVKNGSCYRTTVRRTEAMSPAFVIEDYNDWQSGQYSTWTESSWQETEAMLFLRPSVAEEVALVCGGVVSIVLSLILVYFMNSRADLLFGLPTPPAAC